MWDEVESGCNGGLLGNSGHRCGPKATQDAQDAQDAKTTSLTSGRNDNTSDVSNIFADLRGLYQLSGIGSEWKAPNHIKSPENREWVSVIMAISAAGNSIPPLVMFKGKQVQHHGLLLRIYPTGL